MSCLEIDPTFVLKYLNDLGYRNITTEQLKEFIRDLKKLIKYDKSRGQPRSDKENIDKYFMYMRETESSRAKRSQSSNTEKITGTGTRPPEERILRTNSRVTNYSKSTSSLDKKGNLDTLRTSGQSTVRETHDRTDHTPRSRTREQESRDVMWIRPKSVTRAKKNDPVSLYHSYQSDWNRFKNQIPIDNKHQDLRWNIRKKTMR